MKYISRKGLIIIFVCVGFMFAEAFAYFKKDGDKVTTRNLRVIKKDISHDELIKVMRDISKALSVKCGYCHVEIPGQKTAEGHPALDFASDAKETKIIARKMMRMTKSINERLADIGDHQFERVECITCHRGHTQPSFTLDTAQRKTSQ